MRPVGVLPIYSAAMRKTLRILIVPALVLALAVPALAVTTYSTGDWKGTTAQKNGKGKHRKLTFYADSTTGEVTKLAFMEASKCSDGQTNQPRQQHDLHTTVDLNGNFVIKAKSKSGATALTLKGTISGNAASGTFVLKGRYNSHTNRPDKNGSIKCSTGTVKWSASFAG